MTKRIILALALGLTAASVRADVSDSGNLIIGGNGVIQGTMTVQGSAFSVGGATFSVAGGSITLGGRLNAAAAGIKWADGTTSTTAASGGGGGVATSSATYGDLTVYSGNTASSYGPCLAGSSVTFTGTGALLGMDGAFYKITTGLVYGRWLVDGATTWNGSSVHSIYIPNDSVYQVNWQMPVTGLSAGSHTACLQYYNNGGGTFRPYTGLNAFPTYWALGVP